MIRIFLILDPFILFAGLKDWVLWSLAAVPIVTHFTVPFSLLLCMCFCHLILASFQLFTFIQSDFSTKNYVKVDYKVSLNKLPGCSKVENNQEFLGFFINPSRLHISARVFMVHLSLNSSILISCSSDHLHCDECDQITPCLRRGIKWTARKT